MIANFEAILTALNSSNGVAFSCHNSDKDTANITAIAKTGSGTIVLFDPNYKTHYNISWIYVSKDSKVYLSTCSIRDMELDYPSSTLEEAVEMFNASVLDCVFKQSTLSDLTYIEQKNTSVKKA